MNERIETTEHKNDAKLIAIPFSMLALGGKFKYTLKNENTYVKISNDITGGCIAAWDDSKVQAIG
jgi:hypothetical protein